MHTPLITPDVLLQAYRSGIFPMAETRQDTELFWVSPERRGIIPLDRFHVPKRLARTVRSDHFTVTTDKAFSAVLAACAAPASDREESWINPEIARLYTELHERGSAHSVECWLGDDLAGGLYGVRLGSAFFGESMFSRARDASKVALVHLVARLKFGGFTLLDTQFLTAHLAQFGAVEIPRAEYLRLLHEALERGADFYWPEPAGKTGSFSSAPLLGETGLTGPLAGVTLATTPGALALQLITQTS